MTVPSRPTLAAQCDFLGGWERASKFPSGVSAAPLKIPLELGRTHCEDGMQDLERDDWS